MTAKVKERAARRALMQVGVKEVELPEVFQDRVVYKSQKGRLGQIKVRRLTGVVQNATYRMVKALEERVGKEDVYNALTAYVGETPEKAKNIARFLEAMRTETASSSLPRLVAVAGIDASALFMAYAKGKLALGQAEAIAVAAEAAPAGVRELYRRIVPKTIVCRSCLGTKKLKAKQNSNKYNIPCHMCDDKGQEVVVDDDQLEIIREINDLAGLKQKGGPSIAISQQVQVNTPPSSYLADIHRVREEIIEAEAKVVEGASVQSGGND